MKQVGKVLRIQKAEKAGSIPANGCLVLSDHERLLWKDIRELADATSEYVAYKAYVQHVMSNLLGPRHVDPGVCYVKAICFLFVS